MKEVLCCSDELVVLNSTVVATIIPTSHSAKSTSPLLVTVSTHIVNVTSSLKTPFTRHSLPQTVLIVLVFLSGISATQSVSYYGFKWHQFNI